MFSSLFSQLMDREKWSRLGYSEDEWVFSTCIQILKFHLFLNHVFHLFLNHELLLFLNKNTLELYMYMYNNFPTFWLQNEWKNVYFLFESCEICYCCELFMYVVCIYLYVLMNKILFKPITNLTGFKQKVNILSFILSGKGSNRYHI